MWRGHGVLSATRAGAVIVLLCWVCCRCAEVGVRGGLVRGVLVSVGATPDT